MSIEIKIYGEDAGHALRELRDFAVGLQGRSAAIGIAETQNFAAESTAKNDVQPLAESAAEARSAVESSASDEVDKRAVGEASGGRKRRTKDEMAADEALTALAAAKGVTAEKLFFAIGQAGRAVVEAELRKQPDASAAAISTGENRVDPENPEPEDDAETQARDAADEMAEVAATRKASATIDDVKAAVQLYVDKFGLKVTQEDGPKIFVEALGAPPVGESFWKFSILPADADKLAKVVSVWQRAAAENPLKREAV